MARPARNNVDYFPFICEDGNKMFYIEETYGNDGFATFLKLLRELAKTNFHYLDLSKPTTLMFLSAKCKVSKEVLLSIINDLSELGKFDSVLWNENNIIWCQDFIDSIQDAYSKRNNNCITYEGLLILLDSLGVRKLNKTKPKDSVNPQSIVKDTKTKESLETRSLAFKETLKPFLNKYGVEMLKSFYSYWSEPNQTKTKLKFEMEKTWDSSRRLENWSKRENNFKKPTEPKKSLGI